MSGFDGGVHACMHKICTTQPAQNVAIFLPEPK